MSDYRIRGLRECGLSTMSQWPTVILHLFEFVNTITRCISILCGNATSNAVTDVSMCIVNRESWNRTLSVLWGFFPARPTVWQLHCVWPDERGMFRKKNLKPWLLPSSQVTAQNWVLTACEHSVDFSTPFPIKCEPAGISNTLWASSGLQDATLNTTQTLLTDLSTTRSESFL